MLILLFHSLLLTSLWRANCFDILKNDNRISIIPDVLLPLFTVQWREDEAESFEQRVQIYRVWYKKSVLEIDPNGTASATDYRTDLFCYPGPSVFDSPTDMTLSPLPTCKEIESFYSETVAETTELLDVIANKSKVEKGNLSDVLPLLHSHRDRLISLKELSPGRKGNRVVTSLLQRVDDSINHIEKENPVEKIEDNDLINTAESGVSSTGTTPREFPNNSTETSSVSRIREIVEKTLERTFTDEEWNNLTSLIKNNWKELGNNRSVREQLQQLLQPNSTDSSLFSTVINKLKSSFGNSGKDKSNHFLEELISSFNSLREKGFSNLEKIVSNVQTTSNGIFSNMFGGIQNLVQFAKGK